jgi:hypothetical protein
MVEMAGVGWRWVEFPLDHLQCRACDEQVVGGSVHV